MAPKREWSDLEISKIDVLFSDLNAIEERDPSVKLDDGRSLRVSDIRESIISKNVGLIGKRTKSSSLDVCQIAKSDVEDLYNSLDGIKKEKDSNVCIEFIKVCDNPAVRLWNSEMKKGKMYPPRMIVDLSKEEIVPNESVMINTGYVIRMPQVVHAHTIEADRIAKDPTRIAKQPNFVIVPMIRSATAHIVPSVYVRDSDDTGLLTVNFTLVSGNVGKFQVVFNAYIVDTLMEGLQIENPEPNVTLFKPKDGSSGRFVRNPQVKVRFDEPEICDECVYFPTFNPLVTPSVTYEKQRVSAKGPYPLFLCSRRREWQNPELLTLGGLIVAPYKIITPKALKANDYLKNTHCMIALKSRAILLSSFASNSNLTNLKLLNGAFVHLPRFNELFNNYVRLVSNLQLLASGIVRCRSVANRLELPIDKVVKVFDYHRNINESTIGNYIDLDDAALFASRLGNASAYSVVIHKSLACLAKWYVDTTTTTTTTVTEDRSTRKRSVDNDDGSETVATKHQKLE